jgi:exodeoxyribonuclease VII small subunit
VPEDKPLAESATPSFESCLQELEQVVKQLEGGDLPLDKSLELFERGMALSETCQQQLEDAETRIEMLVRRGSGHKAEPFRPDNGRQT